MQAYWELYEHGADIGVHGVGVDRQQAFVQAALALTGAICPPDKVAATRAVEFDCESPDIELLFVDWLNRLIFEMASRHMLFSRFELDLQPTQLHARAWGARCVIETAHLCQRLMSVKP